MIISLLGEFAMSENTKLIAAKLKFAEQGRFLTGATHLPVDSRVPPGQGLVKGLPVLDLGVQPEIALSAWSLTIDGAVAQPLCLNHQDVARLPHSLVNVDIHCVTSWTRLDSHWEGVLLKDLLHRAQPDASARYVLLHCEDGYTVNLPLADLCGPHSLLASQFQGESITTEHGGPFRLVIPHLYFWKSPKWIRRIEFLVEEIPGFWEQRGYHMRGDPWKEERYGPKQPLPRSVPVESTQQPVFVPKKEPTVLSRVITWWKTYI